MKILCFSDWRTQRVSSVLEFIEFYNTTRNYSIDLALYGGDDTLRFKEDWSNIAEKTSLKKVLAVIGNDEDDDARNVLINNCVVDLHKKSYAFEGISFIGLEAMSIGIDGIRYTERKIHEMLRSKLSQIPKDNMKILLTHTPPKNHLDLAIRYGHKHIGSVSISKMLENFDFVICGHVHNQGGRKELFGKTQIVNVASMEEHPGIFAVIDTETREIEIFNEEDVIREKQLRKLKDVSVNRIKKLEELGIHDLSDVTAENKKILMKTNAGERLVNYWIEQAALIKANKMNLNPKQLKKYIGERYILYDVETDLTQKKIFLVGCYCSVNNEEMQFFEKKNERKLFREFSSYCKSFEDIKLVSYSNCKLEKRLFCALATKYKDKEFYQLVQNEIDLGIYIRDLIIGDLPSTHLKDLAAFFGYKSQTNLSGAEVGFMYSDYLIDKVEPNWKKIKKYNHDDVFSLKLVIDKINGK